MSSDSSDIPTDSGLDPDITENFYDRLSSSQRKRFRGALLGEFEVYPTARGMYKIYSFKSDQEEPSEYFIIFPEYGRPQCTCRDFLFRCLNEDSHVNRCKHLWRVNLEKRAGQLPPADIDPRDWIESRITSDVLKLVEQIERTKEEGQNPESLKETAHTLKHIRETVQEVDSAILDCEEVYRKWRNNRPE